MKNLFLKAICLIGFISVSQISEAQNEKVLDSVTVYINNQVEVLFEMKDYNLLRDSVDVLQTLKEFEESLQFLSVLKGELNSDKADLLTLNTGSKLTSEVLPSKNIFLRNGDTITNTGIRDEAILFSKNCIIKISAGDFREITNISFQDFFLKLLPELPIKSRISHTIFYHYQNDKMTSLESKNVVKGGRDLLEIGVGAGAGLIKNEWVGDFSVKLGITLFNRDKIWHKFFASANILYDFSNSNKTNINTFLNLGYEFPNSNPETLGMEAGCLISRQGNTFDKNTFRFGLIWSPSSSISVSPQMYFPGKFKDAYPGIRIGFGF